MRSELSEAINRVEICEKISGEGLGTVDRIWRRADGLSKLHVVIFLFVYHRLHRLWLDSRILPYNHLEINTN